MPSWTYIAVKSIGALAMLFLITRILGKKQISQLTFFQYVTGITLGEIAGFLSIDLEGNYMHGVTALIVWTTIPLFLEMSTLKSKKLREWFEGKGRVVIKDGKILEDNLRKERYTTDELLEHLRSKSVFRLADVEFAVLESSGQLSVMLKKEHQPLTPSHLGIKVGPEKPPETVIMDGEYMDEPLSNLGYNREWLETELKKLGVARENVYLAQADSYGELYVDLYDDQLEVPPPNNKQMLYASLKKCQADLEQFALGTEQKDAKMMYEWCAEKMQEVLEMTEPMLKR